MPKVSIIIPTRERAEYLHYSIQTALAIQDPDIEILVNDNCSQDNTREVVEAFDDPRLVYRNTGRRLSMRGNYNEAIVNATGDYLIFFGDDDGIVPGQFPFLRQILVDYQPDGVSWMRGTYGWPEDTSNKKLGGMRFRKDPLFGVPYRYDPKVRNLGALMECRLDDVFPVTPNIYHGCVSRAYIERIAPKEGVFLNSVNADVNFEYRSILEGGDFVHVDHMFTVNGFGKQSTGGAQKGHKLDSAKNDPAKLFDLENESDPYNNLFSNERFVPLAFFVTLETIRDRGAFPDARPDYIAWYTYILQQARKKVHPFEGVKKVLKNYAKSSGSQAEFEAVLENIPKSTKSFSRFMEKAKHIFKSVRVDVDADGQNTIVTAVQTCDLLLATDYADLLAGKLKATPAWLKVKARARAMAKDRP